MGLNFGSWCGGYATKRIGLMLSYDAQWMMAGVYTSAVVVVHLFVGTIFCGWLRLVTPLFQPVDSSNMRRDLVRWLLFFFFCSCRWFRSIWHSWCRSSMYLCALHSCVFALRVAWVRRDEYAKIWQAVRGMSPVYVGGGQMFRNLHNVLGKRYIDDKTFS